MLLTNRQIDGQTDEQTNTTENMPHPPHPQTSRGVLINPDNS